MIERSEPRFAHDSWPQSVSVASAVLLIIGGSLAISGWLFDIQSLKSISQDWGTMKVNTAARGVPGLCQRAPS